jgi:diadenylate cyclase
MVNFGTLRWQDVVDFLVLGMAFYVLVLWAKQARALRIAFGILGLHAAAVLARNADLIITSIVLDAAATVAIVFLVLVFQSELRRALIRLDTRIRFWVRMGRQQTAADRAMADALFGLAAQRTGALVVVQRHEDLLELVDGGIALRARVSWGILEAIFQKQSPLHDGAVILEQDEITRAEVVLPLTTRADVPPQFGTRHRAAMGIAERSDALAITVSEERGDVHAMWDRVVLPLRDRDELLRLLETQRAAPQAGWKQRMVAHLKANWHLRMAAVGLTAIIWSMSFYSLSATVRTVTIPVEFSSVPRGMAIAEQSASALHAQIRGNAWLMESVVPGRLVARFDLSGTKAGWRTFPVRGDSLDLPPGVVLESVSPGSITVHVTGRSE